MKFWEYSALGVCLVLVVVGLFFIPFTDGAGEKLDLKYGESSLSAVKDTPGNALHAKLSGSIYEGGETVSVYGTCLNATDGGFPNTYGTLSAWYPNGTLLMSNISMTVIQNPGYFLYTGPMNAVQGTYLTEFQCHVNGTDIVAKAFGEWQNPEWVKRINDTYTLVSNLSNNTQNWFNITWDKIDSINVSFNASFENITNQLIYIAQVANGSVDRNDSYLALLIQNIGNSLGIPVTHALNVTTTIDPNPPRYMKSITYISAVENEFNLTVGEPTVGCLISTTNYPPSVNQNMVYNTTNRVFTYTEAKYAVLDQITYNVSCHYN